MRGATTLVLTLLAMALSATMALPVQAQPTAHASIVGGGPAGTIWPFMAFVSVEEPGNHSTCSGTLVEANLVLTAGHCVVDEETNSVNNAEDVLVHLGSPNWSKGGRWYRANALYPDPAYRVSSSYRDAGLIELTGPVPYPTIPLSQRPVTVGTEVFMLGWGTTTPPLTGDGTGSRELMIGESVVQSNPYCTAAIPGMWIGAEICTLDFPDEQTSICYGDSGGPTLIVTPGGPVEVGVNDEVHFEQTELACDPTEPDTEIRANVEANWVYRVAARHAPELPLLTIPEAKRDVIQALSKGSARGHFIRRRDYADACRPVEESKVQCAPEWSAGGNDYSGRVTIYLVWENAEAVWNYRYRLSWVREACLKSGRHCHIGRLTR